MNHHELKDQADNARRELEREAEQVRDREMCLSDCLRLLDVTDDLLAQIDRLEEELERSQRELDEMVAQMEQQEKENTGLRQQLLESENQHLAMEKQQLESEAKARPAEIHNHFGKGSSAQVFNDKVTGKFSKIRKWKQKEKREKRKT